jgi:hypothetical protein
MSKPINDGGSAFPQHGWTSDPVVLERMKTQGGMTLRDFFAAAALTGSLANGKFLMMSERAEDCYEYADKMLAARKEGEQ